MPILPTLTKEQVNPYVDYCAANISTLTIDEGNEIVRKMLRIPRVYDVVFKRIPAFETLYDAVFDLARGCDVLEMDIRKIIEEYNSWYGRNK